VEKRLKPAVGRSSPEDQPSDRIVAVAGRLIWSRGCSASKKNAKRKFFYENGKSILYGYIPRSPVLNSDESLPELVDDLETSEGPSTDASCNSCDATIGCTWTVFDF
jgi:hypothetical protein